MVPWNLAGKNGHVVLDIKPDFGVDTVFVLHRLSSYAREQTMTKKWGRLGMS